MKIEIKEDITTLMGKNAVYFKNDTFYLGDVNFYSIMKIIKFLNNNLYLELMRDTELSKYAINSLLYDNRGINLEDILAHLINLSSEEIFQIGIDYREYLLELLKTKKFEKDDFKGLIYDDMKIDYEFLFTQFKDLKVLFVYNEDEEILKILDRNGRVLKKEKISPSDLCTKFDGFREYQVKEESNNYWNKLIKEIIDRLFNLELFFQEFRDEIFKRIAQILMIVDLSEENEVLLNRFDKEEGFNEELSKLISDKINNKNKEMNKKYGIKL